MEDGKSRKPQGLPASPDLSRLAAAIDEGKTWRSEQLRGGDRRSRGGQIHVFLLLALVLVLGVVIFVTLFSSPRPTPVSMEVSLQEAIYVTALAINAEFMDTGRYPVDLETIGMDEEGLSYTLQAGEYTLTGEADGVSVTYHSGEDLEPFRSAFEKLLPPFREGR